jgi:hypothetical protein
MHDFRKVGHDLARMSGVDLQSAGPATVRAWEARGLALHHLAAGDMAEANKIMAPFIRPLGIRRSARSLGPHPRPRGDALPLDSPP